MYNAQTTKSRIMGLCEKQSAEQMLKALSLGVNAIRQINDTKGMASFSLAKIADYLDCSVDYLLGRTNDPQSHFTSSVNSTAFTADEKKLVDAYRSFNDEGKSEALKRLSEMLELNQYKKCTSISEDAS